MRERPPAGGGWSAAGIVEHLAIVEARIADRISGMLADARERLAPETDVRPILPTLDLAALGDRGRRLVAVEAVQPTGLSADAAWRALEDAGIRVRGALTACDGLAIGAHEGRHADQIRQIASPGGPAA